jgi:hypothetical protein
MSDLIALQMNKLPSDISNIILELCGYHKLRNGKFISQLNKNDDIFKLLLNIPLVKNSSIMLIIRTERMRNSWYDKIITIETETNEDYKDDYSTELVYYRNYDCSWYDTDHDKPVKVIREAYENINY